MFVVQFFKTKVDVSELLGHETIIYSTINNQDFIAKVDARENLRINDEIELSIDVTKLHLYDMETENLIK